LYQNTNNN
jgi:chitinase